MIKKIIKLFKPKKKKYLIITVGVLLVAIFMATFGRYVINIANDYLLKPKTFFFTSDILSESSTIPEYYVYTQKQNLGEEFNFSFDVRNYEDSKRWTQKDIAYTLAMTSDTGLSLNSPTGGTLIYNAGARTANNIPVTVTLTSNMSEGTMKAINITAESTSPFKKTIKGKINVVFKAGIYTVEDMGDYVLLTINVDETVVVTNPEVTIGLSSISSNLQLDMTNTLVKEAVTLGNFIANTSVKLKVLQGNSYQIKLFKTDVGDAYVPGTIVPVFNY